MVEPTAHLGCMVQPIAPRLQTCTARYSTKQHKIKSRSRENDATKRRGKHDIHEAAAGVTQHAVLQQTVFHKSKEYSKIKTQKYRIVNNDKKVL